jgi:hypothetical protein
MWTFQASGTPEFIADLSRIPAELASTQVQRQAHWQRSLFEVFQRPSAEGADEALRALWECVIGVVALPFDVARAQHAAGVHAGALPRSLMESQHFEQQIGAIERLTLGPLARSV